VQERLDQRIRHVLIDEFQDTSPLQWQACTAGWAAYAGAGGGASGQRPPAVFIVGDPKQSIYRFRNAEPRVFDAARDFVRGGLHGTLLACDHTRRNAPAGGGRLNAVFDDAQGGRWLGPVPRAHHRIESPTAGLRLARVPRPEAKRPRCPSRGLARFADRAAGRTRNCTCVIIEATAVAAPWPS
jgi:ATP-dependent helicase/nuclease subunit A